MHVKKARYELKITFTGETAENMLRMREYYGEPITKILFPDIIAIVQKHKERMDTPANTFLKKK